MKLGKLEVLKHKKYPIVAVKFNGKHLFYIEDDGRSIADIIREKKAKKPVVKNNRAVKMIAGGLVALTLFSAVAFGCAQNNNNSIESQQTTVQTQNASSLDFVSMSYGSKTYLTLEEDDLLELIEQAMKEVDAEYVNNGNKTVFNVNDNEYSQFTKYDILGILQTESSLRLIEIKDKDGNIFDVNNYERFYGKDAEGVVYYGPGMMSKTAVEYIVNQDRLAVNNFDNYEYFNIEGKQIKITYENLNPYDYVINSGAKTKKEIQRALKECISLNVKSIYVSLNRFVKDNVKVGTHDTELEILNKYDQLKELTTIEKQKAYAYIAYNNGPTKVRDSMLNGTLYAKHTSGENKGKYIINVNYAEKVHAYADDFYQKLLGQASFD